MDPKTILKTLKEASPFDLFLVSFLLLPFVFDAWVGVFDKLHFDDHSKYFGLSVVLVGYAAGVGTLLLGSSREKRREIARDQIVQYLTAKNFEMMSFDGVRKNINRAYTDEFLENIIRQFPNDLRRARLKGGVTGLARLVESQVENES